MEKATYAVAFFLLFDFLSKSQNVKILHKRNFLLFPENFQFSRKKVVCLLYTRQN